MCVRQSIILAHLLERSPLQIYSLLFLQTSVSENEGAVVNGINASWELSNSKNDALVRAIFGANVKALTEELRRRYLTTNDGAREAFLQRKQNGLNLSDYVWRYTKDFKSEIELALDCGIRSGESAAQMSRSLRQYLQHPGKLFRRVRDEHGLLRLSQRAKNFNPGRGVYRSSYKNARRLAATETNIAYRTADYLRWQQMDFVVGIEIMLSNNHTVRLQAGERTDDPTQQRKDGSPKANAVRPLVDICDELQGRYPKDFKFTGWHPHCRCRAISILKTEEEMARDTERILRGEEPLPFDTSVNAVRSMPKGFSDWTEKNTSRIEKARKNGTLPYFLRDNVRNSKIRTHPKVQVCLEKQTNSTSTSAKSAIRILSDESLKPPYPEEYIEYYGGKVMVSPMHGENELQDNLQLASRTANYTGKTVWLLPRISPTQKDASILRAKYLPKGVFENKNPDFFLNGKLYDGKTFTTIHENYEFNQLKKSIENHIKKAKLQAQNMIFALPPYVSEREISQIVNNYLNRSKSRREIIIFLGDAGYSYSN